MNAAKERQERCERESLLALGRPALVAVILLAFIVIASGSNGCGQLANPVEAKW
jgi:hypothetical protein